jgi:hypothetical protein
MRWRMNLGRDATGNEAADHERIGSAWQMEIGCAARLYADSCVSRVSTDPRRGASYVNS